MVLLKFTSLLENDPETMTNTRWDSFTWVVLVYEVMFEAGKVTGLASKSRCICVGLKEDGSIYFFNSWICCTYAKQPGTKEKYEMWDKD